MIRNTFRILMISPDPGKAVGGIATWTNGYLTYCQKHNISCDLVDTSKINKFRYGILNELVRTGNAIFALWKKMNSGTQYNVVHLNTSVGFYGIIRDYFLAKIVKKKKLNLLVHFHCDVQYWDERKIIQYFLKRITKIADCCVVLCNSSQDRLYQMYNKRSVIIPNYIDPQNIRESREVDEHIRTVIYTGRVSTAKGSVELFELAKRFPDKCFLLVGKIILDLSNLNVPPNVKMLGERVHEEVLELLDKADVFLFPSHSEGFSIALTEAMAKGLPSIVTDTGANRDMISDGSGIVVPIGDVDEMELALNVMEDPSVRQKMSDNALRKVQKEYAIDTVLEQIKVLYQGIMSDENK